MALTFRHQFPLLHEFIPDVYISSHSSSAAVPEPFDRATSVTLRQLHHISCSFEKAEVRTRFALLYTIKGLHLTFPLHTLHSSDFERG